jgi:hypothetical protein
MVDTNPVEAYVEYDGYEYEAQQELEAQKPKTKRVIVKDPEREGYKIHSLKI